MGLSPEDFGQMRLSHFFVKLIGHVKYKEEKYKEQAELVRLQTVSLINVNLARKDQIQNPTEFWKFPWDGESTEAREKPEADPAKMKQLLKAFKQ